MTWFGWVFIGFQVYACASTVLAIGKPRQALAPAAALVGLVVGVGIILGVLLVGTGSL